MIAGSSNVDMTNRFFQLYQFCTRVIAPGILFSLASCTNSIKEINEVLGRAKVGEDRGKDVTILYSRAGHLTTRLFGHTFVNSESSNPPFAEMKDGLKVEFFNDSLKIINTLTARYARWYQRENNVLIRDSVRVINDKGEELQTSELVWNQKIQKFFTEKPVKIITKTQVLYGTGMEASQDFKTYHITNLSGKVIVQKNQVPGT